MIEISKNRTNDIPFDLEGIGGVPLEMAAGDKVRAKVSKTAGQATPDLELISGANTPNGSTVNLDTSASPPRATVRIAQADAALLRDGPYVIELIFIDDSELTPADAAKSLGMFPADSLPTQGGPITL